LLLCISTGRATLAEAINRLPPPEENRRKVDKQGARTGENTQARQAA
jgi:hypothetical protein